MTDDYLTYFESPQCEEFPKVQWVIYFVVYLVL